MTGAGCRGKLLKRCVGIKILCKFFTKLCEKHSDRRTLLCRCIDPAYLASRRQILNIDRDGNRRTLSSWWYMDPRNLASHWQNHCMHSDFIHVNYFANTHMTHMIHVFFHFFRGEVPTSSHSHVSYLLYLHYQSNTFALITFKRGCAHIHFIDPYL